MFSLFQRFRKEKEFIEENKKHETKTPDTEINPSGKQKNANLDEEEILEKFGFISGIYDGGYLIALSGEDRDEAVPDTQITTKFRLNDKVKILCTIEDEGFGNPPSYRIKSTLPASTVVKNGSVTKIHQQFIEFENSAVLIRSSTDSEKFTHNQRFQYTKIQSHQEIDGFKWFWRVTSVSKPEINSTCTSGVSIEAHDIKMFKSSTETVKKKILIRNQLNENVKLIKFNITCSPSGFVDCGNGEKDVLFTLRPNTGKYEARFNVFPRNIGKINLSIVANFEMSNGEKIEKNAELTIEILDNERSILKAPNKRSATRFVDAEVRRHTIPEELRRINLKNIAFAMAKLAEAFPSLPEMDITTENYLDKIKFAIYLEELAVEQAFASYRIKEGVFEDKNGHLRLNVEGVAEKRPSVISGDIVRVMPYDSLKICQVENKDSIIAEGRIFRVEQDSILVDFDKSFHKTHNGGKFSIDFEFSRTPYRYQHHAVEKITEKFGNGFIFPKPTVSRHPQIHASLSPDGKILIHDKERDWFDKQLNQIQKEAVINVLRGECRPLPYIIYGPPGTGKTKTMIELVKQLFTLDPSSRIMIASQSNSAANIFTEAFIKSEVFNKRYDFVRFVSNNQIEKAIIPDFLKKFCATISTARDYGGQGFETPYTEDGLRQNCTRTTIMKYRICIGTLQCLGALMNIKFPNNHFRQIIIDEAGQATEACTFMPIVSASKEFGQVVLAGDPRQLGPISNSQFVKKLNLDFSMLERLLRENECYALNKENEYDCRFVTKLVVNYRSTPSVLSVYNGKLFYNGELKGNVTEDSTEAELPSALNCDNILWSNPEKDENCGVYFVDVTKGQNRRIPNSSSWYNDAEISSIISFLNKLTCNESGMKYPFKDIGIITPYALQVKELKKKVSDFSDTDLKIGTVEDFQGQERMIILLSTVRTDEKLLKVDSRLSLGFLQCGKRINVALSRARSLLVIFGKGEILKTDERWREVINYAKQNGTFVVDDRT